MKKSGQFNVVLLGIVFDPEQRKILIGKKGGTDVKKLVWAFPGGKPEYGKQLDDTLKKKIRAKTGLKVANLGSIFSMTHKEDPEFLLIYHLCEVVGGKEKPGDDIMELKWVRPDELERYLTVSFHPHLKEYIMNLK